MAHSIRDIAAALGAEAAGNLDLTVNRAAEPQMAGPQDLALAMDPYDLGTLTRLPATPRSCAGSRLVVVSM